MSARSNWSDAVPIGRLGLEVASVRGGAGGASAADRRSACECVEGDRSSVARRPCLTAASACRMYHHHSAVLPAWPPCAQDQGLQPQRAPSIPPCPLAGGPDATVASRRG